MWGYPHINVLILTALEIIVLVSYVTGSKAAFGTDSGNKVTSGTRPYRDQCFKDASSCERHDNTKCFIRCNCRGYHRGYCKISSRCSIFKPYHCQCYFPNKDVLKETCVW